MNNSKTATNVWIVLANDHQARLISAKRTPTGRCHLSETEAIENPIPTHDRGRPIALHGMTGHSYADNLRTLDEERRRFARQLSRWIHTLLQRHDVQHLTVFAPPKLIGCLRVAIKKDHTERIDLIVENLMRLSNDSLRCHHSVMSLLGLHPKTDQREGLMAGFDQGSTDRPARCTRRDARGHRPMRGAPG